MCVCVGGGGLHRHGISMVFVFALSSTQLTDFEAHFAKTARDINEVIPDKNFTGYGVIDWEKWRPVYDRNWDAKRRYQEGSVELVREQHPEWSEAKLKAEAKLQFEKSAR